MRWRANLIACAASRSTPVWLPLFPHDDGIGVRRSFQSAEAARQTALTVNPQTVPDTFDVERWWGLVFLLLAACEPEPRGPVSIMQQETMRFDTERIRQEVDRYRSQPSKATQLRMDQAFAALDAKVQSLESLSQTQSGAERLETEQQIADLKRRKELHWARAQTALVETQSVKRAEPVGERIAKAEPVNSTRRSRRSADRTGGSSAQRMMRVPPAPPNFFQRLFR